MASAQAQGKGKKKNKEVTKVSLEEFNQIDAPHGHSVVSLKTLDWAETMADYEQHATETQQIIVPALPRAQRGPGVDFDSLPSQPPFRCSLFNLPLSVEEKEICEKLFQGLDVINVEITKSTTTVELGSQNDLYDALCKDGVSIKGRTINVCLYGQSPQNNYQERYGGRGGNSYGDRYGERGGQGGGFGGARTGDRYNDRPSSGGYGRDRESYSGFSRGGGGGGPGGYREQRSSYGDRYSGYERNSYRDAPRGSYTSGGGEPVSEEPENWRTAARPTVKPPSAHVPAYNNGSRQPYMHSRQEQSYYQPPNHQAPSHNHQESSYQPRYQPHHNQSPSNNMPSSQYNDRAGPPRTMGSAATSEQRPKLVIKPRQTPINVDDVSTVSRNESIFGQAKPSSKPYEKIREVEQKLSAVQISDDKTPSQSGSQPGSAPRSRQISERSSRD